MKMEQTQCSETLAFRLHTSGNHPEKSIRHSEYDKSLESKSHYFYQGFLSCHWLDIIWQQRATRLGLKSDLKVVFRLFFYLALSDDRAYLVR
jgi:hypothetical protein